MLFFFLFQDKETGNKYLDIGKMLFKIETENISKSQEFTWQLQSLSSNIDKLM